MKVITEKTEKEKNGT